MPSRLQVHGLARLLGLLGLLAGLPLRAAVVEFTDRQDWEMAVKHFSAVSHVKGTLQKDVPFNAGLITIVASGPGWVSFGNATNGTLSLAGSGTTRPWFRHTITVNGGKVCAIGWDWSNSGNVGMYKSELTYDGGKVEKIWPAGGKGFLGYIDTQGKTISGFWYGSTGGCNFTGANIENICLSNLEPRPGVDSVPPEWADFALQWKPTWAETLAANPEQQWQSELAGGALAASLKSYVATNSDAAGFVVGLRRMMLLRGLMERFPDEKVRHAEACDALSHTSRQLVLPWWPDPKASPFGALQPIPQNAELATRWETLTGAAKFHGEKLVINPEAIQAILTLFEQGDACLEISATHRIAHYAALDRLLRQMSPEQLAPLRESQESTVRYLAEDILRRGNLDDAVRLSRRAPWAQSVHAMLLELGEDALRQGRREWALASVDDVLGHAADPELRLQAQAAQWVLLAQRAGDRASLQESMAAVADGVQIPWRGGRIGAAELKKQLAPEKPAAAPLAKLRRVTIQLPAAWPPDQPLPDGPLLDLGLHTPWPVARVQAADSAWFVFSPARLARFGVDGSGPAWSRELLSGAAAAPADPAAVERLRQDSAKWPRFSRRPVTPQPAHAPALSADGRILYALLASNRLAVAAFDAAAGQCLWSTAARSDWREFAPMSRPVTADGRLYILTVPSSLAPDAGRGPGKEAGPPVTWRLVCADERDGRVLWTRTLGWQPYTLLDLARGSSGVVIQRGAVYCSTDMGLVARCDARDGALHWVRGYASTAHADPRSDSFSREGSCLPAGDTLFVAPRDHSGIMAFRCDTGDSLWETIAVPSERLIGVNAGRVLAIDSQRLCALEAASGRLRWSLTFPKGTGAQGAIVGGDALAVSDGKLHRITIATGAIAETMDLGAAASAAPLLFEDSTLVEVRPPAR